MKNIIIGISTIFLGIILTFTVMSVNASMTVKNDATNALADSVEESVENCMEDKSYSIDSKDEFISDLVQNLSVGVENTSDLKVDIIKADKEKGVMSIRVESTFLYPNGSEGTATTDKTVIFEQDYKKRNTIPVKYLQYIPDDPVTLDVNEATIKPNSTDYTTHPDMLFKKYMLTTDDKFTIPDAIPTSPTGAEFLYWRTESGKIITKDSIVSEDYLPKGQDVLYLVPFFKDEQQTYTVKFNGNGATSGTMPDQECIIGASAALNKNTFEKTDKISLDLNGGSLTDSGALAYYNVTAKFLGWSTDPNSTTVTVSDGCQDNLGTKDSVVNLYAIWAPATTTLPNAMKNDNNLEKWTSGDQKYNVGDTVSITNDMKFTAVYNVPMCTVTFDTKGALDSNQVINVEKGSTIKLPNTTMISQVCTGWYSADQKVGDIGSNFIVNNSTSLTAKFKDSITTVNYYDVDKNLIKTETLSYGSNITDIKPSKNYTIKFDTSGGPAVSDMTQENRFANWVDDNGHIYRSGDAIQTTKATLNLHAVLNQGYLTLPSNTKPGYLFKYWAVNGARIGQPGDVYQFTGNCTVKAIYEKTVSITVKYDNGSADMIYKGSTGDTYTIPEPDPKTDYVFAGWSRNYGDCGISGDNITFGAQDSTITAQWKLNQVPVTVYEYTTDSDGNNASLYNAWTTSNYTAGSSQTIYSQGISGYQTPDARTITVYAGSTVKFYHTRNINFTPTDHGYNSLLNVTYVDGLHALEILSNSGPYSGKRDDSKGDGTRYEMMEYHPETYWVKGGQTYHYGLLVGLDARISNPGEWITHPNGWDTSYNGSHPATDNWYVAVGDMQGDTPWDQDFVFNARVELYYQSSDGLISYQTKDVGSTATTLNWTHNLTGYTFVGWQNGNCFYAPNSTIGPEDWNVHTNGFGAGQYSYTNRIYLTPVYQKNAWSE